MSSRLATSRATSPWVPDAACAVGLAGTVDARVIWRQVTEIPQAWAVVTGHQMIGRRCGCGMVTRADASDGVAALR
jgi:transposase